MSVQGRRPRRPQKVLSKSPCRPADCGSLSELSLIQRPDQFADKIAPCHDFQSPFVDSRLGCVVATFLCQEPRVFLAIRTRHAFDVLEFPVSQKLSCVVSHWPTASLRLTGAASIEPIICSASSWHRRQSTSLSSIR